MRGLVRNYPFEMAKKASFCFLISLEKYGEYVDTFEEIQEYEKMVKMKYRESASDSSRERTEKKYVMI
jgi:hypothetical protein